MMSQRTGSFFEAMDANSKLIRHLHVFEDFSSHAQRSCSAEGLDLQSEPWFIK
jgi:hypothetical protein